MMQSNRGSTWRTRAPGLWQPAVAMMLAVLAVATPATAQVDTSLISGSGIVRVCDVSGENVDSDGDQYGLEGTSFIAGPPPGFPTDGPYSCLGRAQTFDLFQTADPQGDVRLGMRMVSQVWINVDAEPEFTQVDGMSSISRQVCLESTSSTQPPITVVTRAKASRSLPENCIDSYGAEQNVGACSTASGRFGGMGATPFMNTQGQRITTVEFIDLADPANQRWIKKVPMLPSPGGGWHLEGGLSGTLITKVMEAPSGRALGDLRFYIEGPKLTTRFVSCPAPGLDNAVTHDPLPFPNWFIDAGDPLPDDFTLSISPPAGPILASQSFDLALMANTGGAAISDIAGTIDGQDVSAALAACAAPTGTLGGLVSGTILTCRGLSGGLLAGIFGEGHHTLAVTLSLGDGRTISDSATWTILR